VNTRDKNDKSWAKKSGLCAGTVELLPSKHISWGMRCFSILMEIAAPNAQGIPVPELSKPLAPFGSSTLKDIASVSSFHAPAKTVKAFAF